MHQLPADEKHIQSKTPQPMPPQLCQEIGEVLTKTHGANLGPGETIGVRARHGEEAIWLGIEIGAKSGDVEHFEFFFEAEAPWDFDARLRDVIDFAGGSIQAYFEADRDGHLALDFSRYPFEGFEIFARQERINPTALAKADALLKEGGFDPDEGL